MDVEYGGGRTVPRVAVVGFDEKVLYYSDFCLRYEDWIETKLTEIVEQQQPPILYTSKIPKDRADTNSDENSDLE